MIDLTLAIRVSLNYSVNPTIFFIEIEEEVLKAF